MIAKMCEECQLYVTTKCEGKDQDKVNKSKMPCKNYQLINFEELNKELHTEGEVIVHTQLAESELKAEPIQPEPTKTEPDKESKAKKFSRICQSRLAQVQEEFRKLSNLGAYYTRKDGSRVYTYDWTNEQREDLIKTLESDIERLRKTLTK